MKKKLFVVFMTIAMAVSLVCGMSFMTASASNDIAAQDAPAVNDEITAVDYENAAGGYGMAYMAKGFSQAGGYWASIGMEDKVVVTKADGTVVSGVTVECCGTQLAIMRYGAEKDPAQCATAPVEGDTIRFLAGFTYGACYLGEDVVFVYSGSGFVKQLPESAISEIEVTAIGYNESWGGPTVQFELSIADANAYAQYSSGDKGHLSYVNAFGEVKPLADCTYIGSKNYIARIGNDLNSLETSYKPMKGDIFTVRKGFMLTQSTKGEKVNKDFAFIYNGQGFIAYDAATHAVTELSITNEATRKYRLYRRRS